jgi:hypothetical protein
MQAEETSLPIDLREFHSIGQRGEDRQVCQPDERVDHEQRAVRVRAVQAERTEEADGGRGKRAERAGEARDGVVDREQPGAALGRRCLR